MPAVGEDAAIGALPLLHGASFIGGASPGSAPSPWQIQGMNAD
jgi:hypothetical protein